MAVQAVTPSAPADGWEEHSRGATHDPDLMLLRAQTAAAAAPWLRKAGQQLHIVGHIVGPGRTAGSSPRGNGDDSLVAMGVLAQVAASLLEASGVLLSGTNHYAGAALLRQMVEVEYLTWAFANQKREAADWLNSTHQDRIGVFSPRGLRDVSDGHFLAADYRHHCELAGHPVPRAIPLLGGTDLSGSQTLLVDLLLHSWRTADNITKWAKQGPDAPWLLSLHEAKAEFGSWGQGDPLYQLVLTESGPGDVAEPI